MSCILCFGAVILKEQLQKLTLGRYCTHGCSTSTNAVSILHFGVAGVEGKQPVQATQEVYNEVAMSGLVLKTPLAHGILEAPAQNEHIYRMEVTLWFSQVRQLLTLVSNSSCMQ